MARAQLPSKKLETKRRIYGYVRVSTEEQAENPEGSIKNQEQRLRQAVEFKNMESGFGELVQVFVERGKSGKNTNRAELQKLLSAIRCGEVDLVIVTELSRLSRSIRDFAEIWELMQAHNCGFMSLRENFDTTTAAGEMILFTLAGIAQFERKQVSERVKAGFSSRASRGLFNGGTVALGYKIDSDNPGHLKLDPQMSTVVQKAFVAFLEHGSLTATAKWLNEHGYKISRQTVCGRSRIGFFIPDNLYSVLTNRAYLGIRSYRDLKGNACETKAAWPALIAPELFDRVQAQLRKNHCRLKPVNQKNRHPYLLSGLLKCGSCGDGLPGRSANGNGGKIPYYEHGWATKRGAVVVRDTFRCNPHRVLAARLEPLVWNLVRDILTTPEVAAKLIEQAHVIHARRMENPERERLRKASQGYTNQIESLTERLSQLPKGVSATPIFAQMQKLEEMKSDSEMLLANLSGGQNNGAPEIPATLADYARFIAALRKLPGDDPTKPHERETCRRIVHRLIHRIEIFPDRARVHYFVGRGYVQTELARQSFDAKSETVRAGVPAQTISTSSIFFASSGSTTLTNGACDLHRHKQLKF